METGGADRTRTGDLLRDRVIRPISKPWPALVFCYLANRLRSKNCQFCSQVVPKFAGCCNLIIEKRRKRGSGGRARYTIVDDLGEGRANPCLAPAAGVFVYTARPPGAYAGSSGVHHRDRGGAHISRSPEVLERRRLLEGATA